MNYRSYASPSFELAKPRKIIAMSAIIKIPQAAYNVGIYIPTENYDKSYFFNSTNQFERIITSLNSKT